MMATRNPTRQLVQARTLVYDNIDRTPIEMHALDGAYDPPGGKFRTFGHAGPVDFRALGGHIFRLVSFRFNGLSKGIAWHPHLCI